MAKRIVMARERLTVTTAVKALTASKYDQSLVTLAPNQRGMYKRRAQSALVTLENSSGDIHYTKDGTDPTTAVTVSGVGFTASARDVIPLDSLEEIINFKMIALASPDAIVEVVYYR